MRIHIIGGSGSGKTYLARQLSRKYQIPHLDLDEIFWDNTTSYGKKASPERRKAALAKFLTQTNWIIEGVYYDWLDESFQKADVILLLDIPLSVCRRRIIRRFFRRKIGLEEGEIESLHSLTALLKWTGKYQRINLPEIRKALRKYAEKTVVLSSASAVAQFSTSF